jgi:hypothetical protein
MSDRFTPSQPTSGRADDASSPFPRSPAPSKSNAPRKDESPQPSKQSRTRSRARKAPNPVSRAARPRYAGRGRLAHLGVEANERLTGATALVLLVLLAIEGATIIRVHSLLTLHVFIGALLVPPVLVKMSSTLWRFAKYYLGTPEYRHKGPPPVALRVLGPFTVILTALVFVTGFLLLLGPQSMRNEFFQLHRASFIAWFAVMVIHVLAHLGDMTRSSTKDWTRRTRQLVAGARARRVALAASLVIGLGFALAIVSYVGPWLHGGSR